MTSDKERWSAVTSVFNVGFHRGAVVSRYRRSGGSQIKETFDTYVPRAIASISALESTLEDRSLMLMLQRKPPGLKMERFSPRHLERLAQAYRDECAIFALTSASIIEQCYHQGLFAGLETLDDDRAVNLWEPLLSISSVADAETSSTDFTDRLTALAQRMGADRDARSGDEPVSAILEVLRDCLGPFSEIKVSTTELSEKVRDRLGWETLTYKALSQRLHPLWPSPIQMA